MVENWKCPHCGSSNEKRLNQGNIVNHLGNNQILFETSHPNHCPRCQGEVNGAAILSGHYDDNWADLKAGLKEGLFGLMAMVWLIGAFWLFPFAFRQNLYFGIVCVLVWLSPGFLIFRRR